MTCTRPDSLISMHPVQQVYNTIEAAWNNRRLWLESVAHTHYQKSSFVSISRPPPTSQDSNSKNNPRPRTEYIDTMPAHERSIRTITYDGPPADNSFPQRTKRWLQRLNSHNDRLLRKLHLAPDRPNKRSPSVDDGGTQVQLGY